MSQARDDDLISGPSFFSFDLPRLMEAVTEAVQEYSRRYTECLGSPSSAPGLAPSTEGRPAEREGGDDRSLQVNEVLLSLMSEIDKLGELSRLLGKLRFAVEGNDVREAEEAGEEISALGRHLPEDFQVPALLAVARDTSQKGSRLAQLYLDRCFRLSAGDVESAKALEEEIQSLQSL